MLFSRMRFLAFDSAPPPPLLGPQSLSALGDVVAALAEKRPHVPYRNSKLTSLLQEGLAAPNAKVGGEWGGAL